MKNRMIFFMVIVIGVITIGGIFMYRHFVLNWTLDRPSMENPEAPMLELLSAEWTSEDGVWCARIEGETLDLSYQQDLMYSGSFFFGFVGDDLNVKTELDFYDQQFESEDGSISSTIESLYVENCRLYLDITISKEGESSIRQLAILDRMEYGKPAESESEGIREVSEMAKLLGFSWHQSAMSYDGCFDFQITSSEPESTVLRLYCDFTNPETGERIKIGEENSGFQGYGLDGTRTDSVACPAVPLECWEKLADFLHNIELPAYCDPDPDVLDAIESERLVTWRDGSQQFTKNYNGTSAHDLLELLQNIAGEAYRKAEEEP